jgi:FlaA1/EpsC-like NDP-sugar epimerase
LYIILKHDSTQISLRCLNICLLITQIALLFSQALQLSMQFLIVILLVIHQIVIIIKLHQVICRYLKVKKVFRWGLENWQLHLIAQDFRGWIRLVFWDWLLDI